MFGYNCLLLTASIVAGVSSAQSPSRTDIRDLKPADEAVLLAYLQKSAMPPDAYVIGKFKDHDLVILGEMHEIRDNLEFVGGLIAPLYHKAGVRVLATEFLRYRNTEKANRIVTAPEYQEEAVVDLYRDFAWIWGFKEYMDIFKAVWALNRSLPPGAEKFRILGLDQPVDMYELWAATDAERKKEIQATIAQRDQFMAENLLRDAFRGDGKVLLHTGFAHSFTHRQYGPGRGRLGAMLRERLGDRVFQICLHMPNSSRPGPQAGGRLLHRFIEDLFEKNGNQPAGFDIAGSPFADLTNADSAEFLPGGKETLAEYTRGYVFLKPIRQIRKITWVDGFVDAKSFDRFRFIALRREWIKENQCQTPAELDKVMKAFLSPPPPPPLPKAVKLDAAVLDRYAGAYQMGEMPITVTRDGEKLWMDCKEGKFELLPESETVFFLRDIPAPRIIFAKDESGKVDRLITRRNGREFPAKRVGP